MESRDMTQEKLAEKESSYGKVFKVAGPLVVAE